MSASPPREPAPLVAGRAGPAIAAALLLAVAAGLAWWQVEPWQWPALDPSRWWTAAAVAAAYAGSSVAIGVVRTRRAAARTRPAAHAAGDVLVVHASQTGRAEELADLTVRSLVQAGVPAATLPLAGLGWPQLATARRVLFVASTTGEGDAPDAAARFVRQCMGSPGTFLPHLEYAVLALGDRDYSRFCAFGHQLDKWLRQVGARPLFGLIEVDDGDPAALASWQRQLARLTGQVAPHWSGPGFGNWRLCARRHLNPGSPGAPVFDLALAPPADAATGWQAGDIAEIRPRNPSDEVYAWLQAAALPGETGVTAAQEALTLAELAQQSLLPPVAQVRGLTPQAAADLLRPLPHREYSIASIPAEGELRLLVRQRISADGALGACSGWLTTHAALDAPVELRVRSNRGFHPPTDARPLVLIGNGTGIAGLRSLLRARIQAGHRRNWLVFGERSRAHDFHFGDELEQWRGEGWLAHLDLVFSREHAQRRYVQHLLGEQAPRLRHWLQDGAAIYVCGSLEGMAPAVHATLTDITGAEMLETMAAEGRYRRDVY